MTVSLKLCEVIESRNNNFNIIRMFAATLVIFSHSFALALGNRVSEPVNEILGISLGYIAVDIFFLTSGLLVCKSLYTSNKLQVFIISRCLRIYPALIVSIFLCSLLGLILTNASLLEYLTNHELREFAYYNGTMLFTDYQKLPGVFYNAPLDRSVNGSLYTLPWELRMYLILIVLGLVKSFTQKFNISRKNWLPTTIVLIALVCLILYLNNHFISTEKHWFYTRFYRFSATFFIGGSLYFLRKYILLKMQWLMISIFVLIFAAYLSKDIFFVAYVFLIPYIVLCLAYIPQGRILTYNTLGDYSYGTYIYAWPIQQTLAITIVGISPLHMFVTAFSFTLLISWLSWNYIEKPSLGLKRHFI